MYKKINYDILYSVIIFIKFYFNMLLNMSLSISKVLPNQSSKLQQSKDLLDPALELAEDPDSKTLYIYFSCTCSHVNIYANIQKDSYII